jgi:DNA invertase Pin-like site-specific DNA recombinase
MKVAIYARVSTNDQQCENQLLALRPYCDQRGWEIANEYVDAGISGSKDSRPALNQLMEDARKLRFDAVAVWRFDRFARSTRHLILALEEFDHLGIKFVSFSEGLDTSSPMGRAMFTIISALSQLERDVLIERTKLGLQRARRQGKRLGRKQSFSRIELQNLTEKMSNSQLAKHFGVSRQAILKARACLTS